MLVVLGTCHDARFKRLGNLPDIESAIANFQQAVDITSDDDKSKDDWLTNLGGCLVSRFDTTGDLTDLEKAISVLQAIVDRTSDNES